MTFPSTVDAYPLTGIVWLSPSFQPTAAPRPLLVFLHAANYDAMQMLSHAALTSTLDAKNWIGISLNGRALPPRDCDWEYSAGYINSPDADFGPAEQDVLDGIDWISSELPVDVDRVYLVGVSMGGAGAGSIAMKQPHRFAGLAMLASVADMYDFIARGLAVPCLTRLIGGMPGDSVVVDTRYKATSPRFLIENANNVPIFYGHGLLDLVTFNLAGSSQFEHGWHMTNDTSWAGCHGGLYCFGHTPAHTELKVLDPTGYDWAFQFTDVHHVLDPRWLTGTPATPNILGTPDPNDPERLLGMFDFFQSRPRVLSPDRVVFKTYEHEHQQSYWLELLTTRPWDDVPAAVRAVRNKGQNRLSLELSRAEQVTIDLELAQLTVGGRGALRVDVERLVEPAFDPALDDSAEACEPTIVLRGTIPSPRNLVVKRDGAVLSRNLLQVSATEVRIGPITVTGPTVLEIFPKRVLTPFAQ